MKKAKRDGKYWENKFQELSESNVVPSSWVGCVEGDEWGAELRICQGLHFKVIATCKDRDGFIAEIEVSTPFNLKLFHRAILNQCFDVAEDLDKRMRKMGFPLEEDG